MSSPSSCQHLWSKPQDFEQHCVKSCGTVVVIAGNPRYCQDDTQHDGHRFVYSYVRRNGEPVVGNYWCDGYPAAFSPVLGTYHLLREMRINGEIYEMSLQDLFELLLEEPFLSDGYVMKNDHGVITLRSNVQEGDDD